MAYYYIIYIYYIHGILLYGNFRAVASNRMTISKEALLLQSTVFCNHFHSANNSVSY